MDHVAGRGSAVRPPPARRLDWETEPLDRRRYGLGEDHRPSVCLDERHRQRLDRQADRRLSGQSTRPIRTMGGYQLMIAGDVFRGRYRRASRSPSRCRRTRSSSTRSSFPPTITSSAKATASWSRCRARGFPSSIAIRSDSCRTSSRRRTRTSSQRDTAHLSQRRSRVAHRAARGGSGGSLTDGYRHPPSSGESANPVIASLNPSTWSASDRKMPPMPGCC